MAVHIVITETRKSVLDALQRTLGTFVSQFPESRVRVSFHHGSVKDWDEEGVCFVNPGNCVGTMNGELDRVIATLLPGVEKDVNAITETWGTATSDGTRHLPLFSAVLTHLNNRWCITAPCMSVGGRANYRGTRNAFHATHAALSMVISANRAGMHIWRVVMPGVCTGHARMNRREAATQMGEAFRAVFLNNTLMVDPGQAAHPRLMLLPLYDHQPSAAGLVANQKSEPSASGLVTNYNN